MGQEPNTSNFCCALVSHCWGFGVGPHGRIGDGVTQSQNAHFEGAKGILTMHDNGGNRGKG